MKRQRFWRNYRWRYLPGLFQRFNFNFKGKGKVKGKVNFKGSKRHTMELHHCGRYQAVLVWVGGLYPHYSQEALAGSLSDLIRGKPVHNL